MWEEIISLAMKNGIWAALFCCLFLYELKDSRRREHKYQDTVKKLTDALELINDIDKNCVDIAKTNADIKSDTDSIKDNFSEVKSEINSIKNSYEFLRLKLS